MKSIISKLLAVLLLSVQGVFTLQGMAIDANDYLGNIPAPGVIFLDQKLALEDKKERTKKQRYGLAAKEVVASCSKWSNSNLVNNQLTSDQNQRIHQPHKKVRSLADVYTLGRMPAEVWKSHCVQLIDYGPSLFPVQLKLEEESDKNNVEWALNQRKDPIAVNNGFDIKSFDEKYIVEQRKLTDEISSIKVYHKVNENIRDLIYTTKVYGTIVSLVNFDPLSKHLMVMKKQPVLINLATKRAKVISTKGENWEHCFSPDGRLCATYQVIKSDTKDDAVSGYAPISTIIEIVIIDLQTYTEIVRFKSEIIAVTGALTGRRELVFSKDSDNVKLNIEFITLRGPFFRSWQFDLSSFKDKEFQSSLSNHLTHQQSTLLMLLDEVKDKNKGTPISLLHDIALKKMLSLRELQATLASFHPLIRDSIIQRYAIIDPTPESMKKATQQKVDENKKLWMNVAKITGVSTLVAALGAWWYLKKK